MKQTLTAVFALLAFAGAQAQQTEEYTLRVLTFEDADWGENSETVYGESSWTSLIPENQYGGIHYSDDTQYMWYDDANTQLMGYVNPNSYGAGWHYYGGGLVISNYGASNYAKYPDFSTQLTVYNSAVEGDALTQTGNGRNGSDNFLVHFGYSDDSGYSTDGRTTLIFGDGEERVIDHLYVYLTTYFLNSIVNGDAFSSAATWEDYVSAVFTGYDSADEKTGEVSFDLLAEGDDEEADELEYIRSWSKVDLSKLGKVAYIKINMKSSLGNAYGLSVPAYFAIDDIAVRFENSTVTTVSELEASNNGATEYYDILGRKLAQPQKGIVIVRNANGKTHKVLVK